MGPSNFIFPNGPLLKIAIGKWRANCHNGWTEPRKEGGTEQVICRGRFAPKNASVIKIDLRKR